MFIQPSKLPARALAGMAVASFAAVGVALVAQHQFGVKPCPWCVLQRLIFLAIGTFSLLGWLVQARRSLRQAARRGPDGGGLPARGGVPDRQLRNGPGRQDHHGTEP